ncbi:rhodanese-like domain-containing protein [Magnetofaba australis]|uniref:Putative rhodanese n=1 Tax=Magnetofaba australis IT-1 TaxID=1434232 RepID=A0A1Y2K207_9PROT|nr:rhodanese-like domain-containing protein [Magnetofaba australis]OSM00232.1 putative rhodanese [Magnetofaba australis IT-1]
MKANTLLRAVAGVVTLCLVLADVAPAMAQEPSAATEPAELTVKITPSLAEVQVKHGSKMVTVRRDQNTEAVIEGQFALTSRKCPPFCAQPMQVAPGVQTIGEVELLRFMQTELAAGAGLVVDARTPDWHAVGTIPGSINVPYTDVSTQMGADEIAVEEALRIFGVERKGEQFDFSQAKDLVLWCNGPWCGQSPTAIRGLLALGYPAQKIRYYRGGMQMWKMFGLTVLPPAAEE